MLKCLHMDTTSIVLQKANSQLGEPQVNVIIFLLAGSDNIGISG